MTKTETSGKEKLIIEMSKNFPVRPSASNLITQTAREDDDDNQLRHHIRFDVNNRFNDVSMILDVGSLASQKSDFIMPSIHSAVVSRICSTKM